MNKFTSRSNELELLDTPNIPKNLLIQNLKELDFINRFLGGHRITLIGIKKLIIDKNKTYTIADIGCGGGDALKYIAIWARKNKVKVKLIGIDINEEAINYLKQNCTLFPEIEGIAMDYKKYLQQNNSIDIIHCSLFCHHLKDEELIFFFSFLKLNTQIGFVINDLQRNEFAYYSIKYLTWLFRGSVLVRNDAPLSVLRGFKLNELENIFQKSNIGYLFIKWMWAFRYLVVWEKSRN